MLYGSALETILGTVLGTLILAVLGSFWRFASSVKTNNKEIARLAEVMARLEKQQRKLKKRVRENIQTER